MNLVDTVRDQNAELLHQAQQLENRIGFPSVHKFGGSSLRSAQAINQVVDIIERHCYPNDLIILSAMGKTTDLLIDLVSQVQHGSNKAAVDFSRIKDYQQAVINELLPQTQAQVLINELNSDIQRIEFLLSRYSSGQAFNDADVLGYGELWSTRVVCAVLSSRKIKCHRVDSRDFIYTTDLTQEQAKKIDTAINWSKSQQLFNRCKGDFKHALAVISGYIACDADGNAVTLGRNGSDFSATIVAKLSAAKMVYLWTDFNGVYSADPNMVSQTSVVPLLGLNEANALANLGTSVFHEKTLKPLQEDNIPIRIRNSKVALGEDPSPGTLILTKPVKWQGAKTIALKEAVCLFSVKWSNGEAHEQLNETLAAIFRQKQIPFYCWLNQHGCLSFCVPDHSQTGVAKILAQKQAGSSCQFSVNKDLSIISLVGFELLQHGDHLSAYFSLIEQSNHDVLLYHYDLNGAISAVYEDKHPVKLVSAIHQAIFVDKEKQQLIGTNEIGVVLCGYGNIGKKLIEILDQRLEHINRLGQTKLKVVAISNSKHYIFDPQGIQLATAQQQLKESTLVTDDIEQDLRQLNDRQLCIVDVTASPHVTEQYGHHFAKGRHVISANKLGMTLPTASYNQLKDLAAVNKCRWLGNVTCGAGLPIQQSIEDLCLSGDRLKSVEGVFSGSVSWILNQFDGKTPFTEVVAQAKALGLTEPDPRDDLSGKDVQRKLLIIARTVGIKLDLEQIQLTPLLPVEYFSMSEQEFADSSAEIDEYMQQKWKDANEQGLKLCYAGELVFGRPDEGSSIIDANIGLSFRQPDEPTVGISAADNIAVIKSLWHDRNPLVIRGPGAGIEVTSAGIVSDLIKLVR